VPLRIALDRSLPIPIGAQLKGQIEYGIVAGTLHPGERLPSVRELAAAESVAHVTVSHVYTALKRDGLITVRPGMGTYVTENGEGPRVGSGLTHLRRLVDGMVVQALERGFTPSQINRMVTARLAGGRARRPSIAVVGLFSQATGSYAREIAALLSDLGAEVSAHTMQCLREDPEELERLRANDLVLTVANRVKEVHDLVGSAHPPVRGLTFVAHPETIERLSALPGGLQIGVVTTFAEFLPTLLQGIGACMPLDRPPLCAVLSDLERVRWLLSEADVIVFASGSEAVLAEIPRAKPTIEYLHTPEPSSVAALRPQLAGLATAWPRRELKGGAIQHHRPQPVDGTTARRTAAL
jgi:DNA-binding transcriptional regulator YhcF (GntR family)